MKKQIRFALAAFALLLLFVPTAVAQRVNLVVAETSDVHGMIFPYNFTKNAEADNSLAQVSQILKDFRSDKNNAVVYLDAGDFYQGQPVIYWTNFMQTKGKNLGALILNYLKVDAMAAGNHDFEVGHPVYDKFAKEMKAPVLAANAVRSDNGKPYFKPYTVIKRNGLKIAVIGMVTPQVPSWLPEVLWSGIRFEDIVESSQKWIKIVQEKEKPDFIIGLFHTGFGTGNEPAMSEMLGKKTAQSVEGYDLICLGHTHVKLNEKVTSPSGKTVSVMQPTDASRALAIAQVPFTKENGKWVKGEISVEVRDILGKNLPADPDYMKTFAKEFAEAKAVMTATVGTMSETITARDSIFGPSKFVDLIHQLQLDLAKNTLKIPADVSITAPLIQNGVLNKGPILTSDLFTLYVYENWLYIMKLSGKEIKNYLEYNYDRWNATMTGPDSYMIRYTFGPDGKILFDDRYNNWKTFSNSYNYDTAAGIDYTVDLSKPAGERIVIKQFSDGRPFSMEGTYNVAINSYRGSGGGGHITTGAGIAKEELTSRIVAATEKDLRVYLNDSIKAAGTVNPILYGNWKYIPEDWVTAARAREFEMWYPAK